EVIAGGGFLRPGDYVDVLMYINNVGNGGYTQTVISGARLLSYGTILETPDNNQPSTGRNAVVAVPSELVNRLLLAEQEGRLRLAARPFGAELETTPPDPAYLKDILPPTPTVPVQQPPSVTIFRGTQTQSQ